MKWSPVNNKKKKVLLDRVSICFMSHVKKLLKLSTP